MKKVILNTALAAMLLLCTAPALRAQELKVGGKVVPLNASGNVTGSGISGTVHYNHTEKILTLTGATIRTTGVGYAIKSTVSGLTVVLQGYNKVDANAGAIYHSQPLTIRGSGTLDVISRTAEAIYSLGTNLTIRDGCTVIANGYTFGIAGNNGSTEVLTIKNSTVKATGANNASIVDFKSLVLDGSVITVPAGARYDDTRTPKGVYANGTLVQSEVLITSRYITLNVTNGTQIKLDLKGVAANTNVKVVSGNNETALTVGTEWTGFQNYTAGADTMRVYGDIALFDCRDNTTKITGINASNNTLLRVLYCQNNNLKSLNVSGLTAMTMLNCNDNKLKSLNVSGLATLRELCCHTNDFSTQALDEIYCALPQRQLNLHATIHPLFDSSSSNLATVMATNQNNATSKGWDLRYFSDYTDIPTTSGTYVCGSTTGVEQLQATEATARIYPNPVSDWLTIETDETIETLQLFDLAGKLLLSQTPQSRTHTLDVSALQSGVYMLKVSGKNGSSVHKVVIAK